MLAAIIALAAAPAILAVPAFGQAAEAGDGGVAVVEWRGPHGDHVIAAAPDGRSAAVQWESVPVPRQEVNGTWAPYAIERTRSGAVEFKGGGLDLTFYRADCSVRTADLGRIYHSLLTAPPSGGAWRVHDATYAECALAIDLADPSRPRVVAERRSVPGLASEIIYDVRIDDAGGVVPAGATAELEWTYAVRPTSNDTAGHHYGFRTSLLGAPVAREGAAVSTYGAAFNRTAAIAANLTWEGMPLDLKDDEHGATSGIILAAPMSELGNPLPRKHPHGGAPQIVIDFRDGRLAEPLRLGGTAFIDPALSIAAAETRTLTADGTAYSRTTCYEGATGNTIGQTAARLVGAYAPRAYECYARVTTHTLPDASDAAVVTGASLTYAREYLSQLRSVPAIDEITWVYFGIDSTITTQPRSWAQSSVSSGIWDGLAGAVRPSGAALNSTSLPPTSPVNSLAPPILASATPPAAPSIGGADVSQTLTADPAAARYYLTSHLRTGGSVASAFAWTLDGVSIDASQARMISMGRAAPTLAVNYSIALQPIDGFEVGQADTRPSSLAADDGAPPYQALTITVDQSDPAAVVPTGLTFNVREVGAAEWLLANSYPDEDAIVLNATGQRTQYADSTVDAWPDGGHALHGRGPFEWRARALYSVYGSNDVQGPWVAPEAPPPGGHYLCAAPVAPGGLNATVVYGHSLNFTWSEPANAPAVHCGPVTYNFWLFDFDHGARQVVRTGLTETHFTTGAFGAADRLRVLLTASNAHGTGTAATWEGTAPVPHRHVPIGSVTAEPVRLAAGPNPDLIREAGGAVRVAWSLNETNAVPADPRPTAYTLAYLRTATSDGVPVWEVVAVAGGAAVREVSYNYTAADASKWAVAGGFLPGEDYRLRLLPEYADGWRGVARVIDYEGPRDRIASSAMAAAVNASSGHTISDVLNLTSTVIDVIHPAGVTYDRLDAVGIQWRGEWLSEGSTNFAEDWAAAAFPQTSAIKSCVPTDKDGDPCLFLRDGVASISARAVSAFLYADGSGPPAGRRISGTEYDLLDLFSPCAASVPAPTGLTLAFRYAPSPAAPAASDEIGNLTAAWNAVPSVPVGTAACTYEVDGYTATLAVAKPGVSDPAVTASGIVGTSRTFADVRSAAAYTATVAAHSTHGQSSTSPASASIATPPWPPAAFNATDYPVAVPGTVVLEWRPPPHLGRGQVWYELHDGVTPGNLGHFTADAGSTAPFRHTTPAMPPADWRDYTLAACVDVDYSGGPIAHACSSEYPGGLLRRGAEPHYLPDAVTDLTGVAAVGSVSLAWSAPAANSAKGIIDYQINWTSPYGVPDMPIPDKAPGNATAYHVTHLPLQTGSSLRVAAETIHTQRAGVNVSGATILNVMSALDFTPGEIDLINETRGMPARGPHIDIDYERDGRDVVLELAWPSAAAGALNCEVDVAVTGRNYTTHGVLPDGPADGEGQYRANLTLAGLAGRQAIVHCNGGPPTASPAGMAEYALTGSAVVESDPLAAPFPFLEWVASFRAGDWGTAPNLGAFDLVTLIIVIISMIGFQRSTPGLGIIFAIMVLGAAAYFELIELETVILGTLALLAMVAIIITRRGRHEVLD